MTAKCALCGEPMPPGEEMFKVHWYSCPCPKPRLAAETPVDEDYIESLNTAFGEYRKACYGDRALPPDQVRETKQAFLCGIHWLANRDSYDPDEIQRALRSILSADNPFISR